MDGWKRNGKNQNALFNFVPPHLHRKLITKLEKCSLEYFIHNLLILQLVYIEILGFRTQNFFKTTLDKAIYVKPINLY